MENENQKSRLTQEEILSTFAVFVLAGWFLSHYLFDDRAEQVVVPALAQTSTQPVQLDGVTIIKSQSGADNDKLNSSPEIAIIGQQSIDPLQSQRRSLQNTDIFQSDNPKKHFESRSSDLSAFNSDLQTVQKQITPSYQSNSNDQAKDITDNVPLIVNQTIIPSVIKNSQTPIASCNAMDKTSLSKIRGAPGIKSIKTDSNHMLRLKGSAEPDSEITVLLNGQSGDSVRVSNTGEWLYNAKLIPGKYTVQVKDAFCEKQSKQFQIYFPDQKISTHLKQSVPITEDKAVTKQTIKRQLPKTKLKHQLSKNKPSVHVNKRQHQVKSGDTLYSLSRRYHVSVLALKKANKLTDKQILSIGQVLKVPETKHP